MLKRVLLVGLILGALALSGCLFVRAPETGVIEGYVTNHLSGEPVVGAVVRAWPMDGEAPRYTVISDYYSPTAVTNSDGYYRLVVPEGLYVVEVRKEGHATSRVEGVKVGSTTRLNIVQKPVFNPNWPVEPPEVTVTGVTEGMTITEPIEISIEAQGPNDIQLIYAAFGKMPGASWLTAPREVFFSTHSTGTFILDPTAYGVSGETTLEIVVYDQNDNRTHVIFHVYVQPAETPATVAPPSLVPGTPMARAVTLSKQVAFMALEPEAAPAGANIYVELRWAKSPDDVSDPPGTPSPTLTGYRVYRKLADEDEFKLIGTVAAVGMPEYTYRDGSADLKVGVEAKYRVTAYKGEAESEYIEASTTPLPPWDVKLLEPADESTGVSLTPTFRWQPTQLVGEVQVYRLWLWDAVHGWGWALISPTLQNVTECPWSQLYVYPEYPTSGTPWERLQPYRTYEWYLDYAVAFDAYPTWTAASVAVNDGVTKDFPTVLPAEMAQFTTGER
ncbi:carboxypeptidase regulatory-like domain-containing protein [Candidatus Bipolaricaulota bacterium]|nr:carboxypeptidase regulatory-like domain-containing protein [Candidatus Bipolaricaulota bacterium]